MTSLREEIDRVCEGAIPPDPVYNVNDTRNARGLSIMDIRLAGDVQYTDGDELLKTIVDKFVNLTRNADNSIQIHFDKERVAPHVVDEFRRNATSFLKVHSNARNVKLTALYQFYANRLDSVKASTVDELVDSVFHIWKYMREYDMTDPKHNKNVMGLLEIIKNKYYGTAT